MSQSLLNPRFLFSFFRKEIRAIAIFSFIANILMLVPTLYMMQVTDRVFYSRSDLTLLTLSVIMVFLYFVLGFSEWIRTRVLVNVSVKIDQLLGLKILRATVYKRLAGINVNSDQIFSDMTQLRQFLTGVAVFALFDLPWMPIYVIVSYFLHPWLGIFALISTLFLIGVAIHAHHTSARANLDAIEAMTVESRDLSYRLRHIDVLESMGMYLNVKNSWLAKHITSLSIYAKQQHATHVNLGLSKFYRYVFQSLSLALGAWLVIQDELRPGAMIAANFLVARATQPVDMIVSSWNQFYMTGVIFQRLRELIADVPDDTSETQEYQDNQSIRVNQLSAFDHNGTHQILEKITIQIDPGSFWVISGPSGAGKTTFLRNLMGVWPYFSGEILYGSNNVKLIDRNSYGLRVGYLPQDVELFDGTIAENISRFGELNSDEVIKVATLVGIHQTILAMSDGYDTMVGDMGANLSGGQRQRIGLARALYGDPDLIILDEPNSSLDDAGQRALFEVLNHLKQHGKKIILVAHYGDLINLATHHMILDKGKLLSAARLA